LTGDPADAEGRDFIADLALHRGDIREADARTTGLGWSGKKRTESDVVEALSKGGAGLSERVSGATE
jgi:hypothetical protein